VLGEVARVTRATDRPACVRWASGWTRVRVAEQKQGSASRKHPRLDGRSLRRSSSRTSTPVSASSRRANVSSWPGLPIAAVKFPASPILMTASGRRVHAPGSQAATHCGRSALTGADVRLTQHRTARSHPTEGDCSTAGHWDIEDVPGDQLMRQAVAVGWKFGAWRARRPRARPLGGTALAYTLDPCSRTATAMRAASCRLMCGSVSRLQASACEPPRTVRDVDGRCRSPIARLDAAGAWLDSPANTSAARLGEGTEAREVAAAPRAAPPP
jgi:hypothetical protein